ncbi:hypothetical protein CgunFtcFv8_011219 [Champsocephalus gunnari]|uniref:Uncharacterized protein n=1 Tax=Champsocephalus gunnari TaxID=52237 RepID=A0AAN8D7K2_CHAGU|nr:hypothetical protein CgunFtcFv8_011219 [Champsocephalus gunnari]
MWLKRRLLLEAKTQSTRHPTPAVNHQPAQNAAHAAHNLAQLACRREQQADPLEQLVSRKEPCLKSTSLVYACPHSLGSHSH